MYGHSRSVVETILVAQKFHGVIVGKGGVTIKMISKRTGAQVDIPSQTIQSNTVSIKGNANQVESAKRFILQLLEHHKIPLLQPSMTQQQQQQPQQQQPQQQQQQQQQQQPSQSRQQQPQQPNAVKDVGVGAGGGGGGGGGTDHGTPLVVPPKYVYLLTTAPQQLLSTIQMESGSVPHIDEQKGVLSVSGTPELVGTAKQCISSILYNLAQRFPPPPVSASTSVPQSGKTDGEFRFEGNRVVTTVKIDRTLHNIVIGKQGATINQIRDQSGCIIEVPPRHGNSDLITVAGASKDQVLKGKYLIEDLINDFELEQKEREAEAEHQRRMQDITGRYLGGVGGPQGDWSAYFAKSHDSPSTFSSPSQLPAALRSYSHYTPNRNMHRTPPSNQQRQQRSASRWNDRTPPSGGGRGQGRREGFHAPSPRQTAKTPPVRSQVKKPPSSSSSSAQSTPQVKSPQNQSGNVSNKANDKILPQGGMNQQTPPKKSNNWNQQVSYKSQSELFRNSQKAGRNQSRPQKQQQAGWNRRQGNKQASTPAPGPSPAAAAPQGAKPAQLPQSAPKKRPRIDESPAKPLKRNSAAVSNPPVDGSRTQPIDLENQKNVSNVKPQPNQKQQVGVSNKNQNQNQKIQPEPVEGLVPIRVIHESSRKVRKVHRIISTDDWNNTLKDMFENLKERKFFGQWQGIRVESGEDFARVVDLWRKKPHEKGRLELQVFSQKPIGSRPSPIKSSSAGGGGGKKSLSYHKGIAAGLQQMRKRNNPQQEGTALVNCSTSKDGQRASPAKKQKVVQPTPPSSVPSKPPVVVASKSPAVVSKTVPAKQPSSSSSQPANAKRIKQNGWPSQPAKGSTPAGGTSVGQAASKFQPPKIRLQQKQQKRKQIPHQQHQQQQQQQQQQRQHSGGPAVDFEVCERLKQEIFGIMQRVRQPMNNLWIRKTIPGFEKPNVSLIDWALHDLKKRGVVRFYETGPRNTKLWALV